MSKSFQSTGNKATKKLDVIKLTPILSEQLKPEDTYKYVPLIDDESGETICMICFKFWHSKNSSLQSTMYKSNESLGNNESKQQQNEMNVHNVPIYNPIYFYVFSETQSFLKSLNNFCNN